MQPFKTWSPYRVINRFVSVGVSAFALMSLTGCYYHVVRGPQKQQTPPVQKTALNEKELARRTAVQEVCDVERIRIRSEALRQFNIENLRKIALKVSQEITPDEIEDLKRIETARSYGENLSPEVMLRTMELVADIYSGAIARAGIKIGATEKLQDSSRTYTLDIFSRHQSNYRFTNILFSEASVEDTTQTLTQGEIGGVYLGPNAPQTRYRVLLLKLHRIEMRRDGTQGPLFEPITLSEFVDSLLPSYCDRSATRLLTEEFDTITGI